MGIIKKSESWFTVPDNEPYHFNFTKAIIIVLTVISIIGIAFCLASCSTARKVRKSYEKAAAYSPITTKDSANAFIIGRKVIRAVPPKIVPGKTIIKKVPIDRIKKVLDTALIAHIADSLTDVVLGQTENYNDNIDGLIRDCNKAVRIALKQGYKQALDSFATIQLPDDTIPNCEETEMELSDFQQRFRVAQNELTKTATERDIYKGQAKKRFWYLMLLIALLGASIFFNVKGIFKNKLPTGKID